jgi:hypothetical protein
VRFQVSTGVKIQVEVFWVVALCNTVVGYHHFRAVKMEAARPSRMLVSYLNATQHRNPENLNSKKRMLCAISN